MVTHQLDAQATAGRNVESDLKEANDDTTKGISSHRLTASSHLVTISSHLAAPYDGTERAKPSCRSRPLSATDNCSHSSALGHEQKAA